MQQNKFHPSKKEIFGGDKSFRLLIAASSGSGKSQLIQTLITDPSFALMDKFKNENVFILCPTLKMDKAYEKNIIPYLQSLDTKESQFNEHSQCFSKDLEQSLKTVYDDIVEKQMKKKESKEGLDHYLIICDDCILEIDLSSAYSQMAKMLCKMRHFQCSIIISLQHMKSIHPVARNQITQFITMSTSNSQEVEKIYCECSGSIKKQQFSSIYQFCVEQPYHYMLVMMQFPDKYRFFKGCGNEIQQLSI